MKQLRFLSCNWIFVLAFMTMTGCIPLLIGAAAGVGGVTYLKGALVKNMDVPMVDIHKASLSALEDLGLFIMSDELNRHTAIIKAEYEDSKSVLVYIDSITERTSKITIRVGALGDQDKSQIILKMINKNL